jgi:hypothetical protein
MAGKKILFHNHLRTTTPRFHASNYDATAGQKYPENKG